MFHFHFAQYCKTLFSKVLGLCHMPCTEQNGVCDLQSPYKDNLQAVHFQVCQLHKSSVKWQCEKKYQ